MGKILLLTAGSFFYFFGLFALFNMYVCYLLLAILCGCLGLIKPIRIKQLHFKSIVFIMAMEDMMNKLVTLIDLHLIEAGALKQIYNIINLEFVLKLAIMPDVHEGYTLPIGGVALMDNVISPECVGVDIGCGMCMLETDIDISEIEPHKDSLFSSIVSSVPAGFNMHEKSKDYTDFVISSGAKQIQTSVDAKLYRQLGTLGGGNHFIELGYNSNKKLCITVHSGSRGAGNIVARHYINLSGLVDKTLPNGFLYLNSEMGMMYRKDLDYFTQYALDNRLQMIETIKHILGVKKKNVVRLVNENHNFADILSGGLVRHRKGATPAENGQIGIIPANMRDGVFVTEGLGNEYYLSSASHGAGRRMGRKQALKSLTIEMFRRSMPENIKANVSKETLDESPDAYKDINQVIAAQEGINIRVVDRIVPLINIKGGKE